MAIKSGYKEREAVKAYPFAFRYPPDGIKQVAQWLLDQPGFSNGQLRILDIGVGDGAFSIPLMETLRETRPDLQFEFHAIDNSKPMLESLQQAWNQSTFSTETYQEYSFPL